MNVDSSFDKLRKISFMAKEIVKKILNPSQNFLHKHRRDLRLELFSPLTLCNFPILISHVSLIAFKLFQTKWTLKVVTFLKIFS